MDSLHTQVLIFYILNFISYIFCLISCILSYVLYLMSHSAVRNAASNCVADLSDADFDTKLFSHSIVTSMTIDAGSSYHGSPLLLAIPGFDR